MVDSFGSYVAFGVTKSFGVQQNNRSWTFLQSRRMIETNIHRYLLRHRYDLRANLRSTCSKKEKIIAVGVPAKWGTYQAYEYAQTEGQSAA